MNKINQNRLIFFLLGAFIGPWVVGTVSGIFRRGS